MKTFIRRDSQFLRFHDLMKWKVREILLVSTLYDGFVLEEDGGLSEKLFSEYNNLDLSYAPKIYRVSSAEEALKLLEKRIFDIVITMPKISDMEPMELGKKIKQLYPRKPVIMLTYETLAKDFIEKVRATKSIDKIFYWSGDSKIILAIIKYVEDRDNVQMDTTMGVQIILVVDDSPWYHSQFLPIIYTEIMKQTQYVIKHAVNDNHRRLRLRARPKILLAETYEEAIEIINQYKQNLLGVISDVEFPKNNKLCSEAGIMLASYVKKEINHLPVILQSENPDHMKAATLAEAYFINKNSSNLNQELRAFITQNYGFGEFVFRYPDGTYITSAQRIADFEKAIAHLPLESLLFHAKNNHFSRWFTARTEFEVAEELRAVDSRDFEDLEKLRAFILDFLDQYYLRCQRGNIVDFGYVKLGREKGFIKIGNGSLGGKARGVAFFNSLLASQDIFSDYDDVVVTTPFSFVICSDIYEEFMSQGDIRNKALNISDEERLAKMFLEIQLPKKVRENLAELVKAISYPLAVRSSSILEDSQIMPFAGIYNTYFLANDHPDVNVRFKQLMDAIRLIYASVFYQSPKRYAKNADLRIEEEKMSVLIQQLVGKKRDGIFYPEISGVAQSYNFYPYSYMKPEEGIVSLALGFGKTIVEGGRVFRFSPSYPRMNPPYSSPKEFLQNSQNQFYALKFNNDCLQLSKDENCSYGRYDLARAEKDGALVSIASTYSFENDVILDSINSSGPRLVSFAQILKHQKYPISRIIQILLDVGKQSFGTDVEIEFAINLPEKKDDRLEIYFLQIRPMISGMEANQVKITPSPDEDLIVKSHHTIGNGNYEGISDIIYVDPETFNISQSKIIATEISELNKILYDENRRCILISFGRIGTSDPWLGVPLVWSQMSQAKVVIEADRGSLQVEPSLGSHFYHNLTSLKMGYFHIKGISLSESNEFINFNLLAKGTVYKSTKHAKLIRYDKPLDIKIDGRVNIGVIKTQDE